MQSHAVLHPAPPRADGIIAEGQTVWRHVACDGATVLNDAANYFLALRCCLIAAKRCVFIVGWDVHSRTPLVGPSGTVDDGYPAEFGPFLHALLADRPELHIHLLIWNSPVIYAGEREWFPSAKFSLPDNDRLIFCYDDCLPTGSAQHQKIVVVDDSIAFSGGLDLTMRRWDSDAHRAIDPNRIDPAGEAYPPFHDVQMMVDGEAARCLAELVRHRWACANCGTAPEMGSPRRIWPDGFAPDFERVKIGISRTEPSGRGRAAINEVDRLFIASIEVAERMIYVENQFLSAEHVARKLAARLTQQPKLELLLIAPKTHASWIEARTMRNGRLEFMKVFDEAGVSDRVRLLHPQVADGATVEAVMVHAKVMIVDDVFLRIGSANLNNRSMGADSECDLVIEAIDDAERDKIASIRNRHLGHFCGVSEQAVAESLKQTGSLIETATTLRDNGHGLHPVQDGIPDAKELVDFVTPVADPLRPLGLERAARATVPVSIKLLALVGVVCALGAVWRFTPLYEYANADRLLQTLRSIEGSPWAPLVIVAGFIVGGLVLFPVTVMIAVTAAALGPWIGFGSAVVGILASASLLYLIGRIVGIGPVQRMLGPRLRRIQKKIVGHGVISVVLVRMLPLAPFSLINMAAGASGVRFYDFILGTIIGMAPGLIAMSVFGAQIADLLRQPSWSDVALLVLGLAVWIAFSIGAQFVVTWWSRRR